MSAEQAAVPLAAPRMTAARVRFLVIAMTAFFTVVDLFATQAILPVLADAYRVTPAAMGMAVNACTIGMAIAGLAAALFGGRVERRTGIAASLVLLSIPTALLAWAPDLTTITALRICQGLCMSTAFTLTLAYLGERIGPEDQAAAFAAYVTGNVGSNLVGRLLAATAADGIGLPGTFLLFAGINLAGAALVWFTVKRTPPMGTAAGPDGARLGARLGALAPPRLLSAYGIGFCILFAFIGVFTYVNFVLVRPPLSLRMEGVGFVYLVFLPSIVLTPLAGRFVARWGTRPALWAGLGTAALGLPALLGHGIGTVLAGMVLVGAGTFFAQATVTGFVSRAAGSGRGAAGGIYLAAYFSGGLAGSSVLGWAFDRLGWSACVAGVAISLAVAGALGFYLRRLADD